MPKIRVKIHPEQKRFLSTGSDHRFSNQSIVSDPGDWIGF